MFGLEVRIFMVRVSYDQKPFRRSMMQTWGGQVFASPSMETQTGRDVLAKDPNNPGSLGMAISEAVEEAASRADTNYALGSVLNHVLLHQTIIGLEAKKQFEKAGDYPDMVFAPCGGGSNFGGVAFPFFADKAAGKNIRLVAVEPTSCPTLTKGTYAYDFGDTAGFTPLMKMYTLGHDFMPPGIHAGGLRYHGSSPLVSALLAKGLVEARAYGQTKAFESAALFARCEGIIPAPETAHAVTAAIDIATQERGSNKCIVFNFSGHGFLDLASYDKYLGGELKDYHTPDHEIERALKDLPKV
jgi:tryptophan synthase beta chain